MLVLFSLAAALAAPAPHDQVDALVGAQMRSLMTVVADLRELPFQHDVPVTVESPEHIRAESLEDLADPEAVAELAAMRATLLAFRLGTATTDVTTAYADIMKESLGGYYSSDERRLVLVEHDGSMSKGGLQPKSDDAMTAAHELVHALQDQHFDLWTMLNRDLHDDDVDLALGALVEGDASLAMLDFTNPGSWASLRPAERDDLVSVLSGERVLDDDSAIGRAPRILRESLLFPYGHGLKFVGELVARGGRPMINQAFAGPPLSSEQILHPERYLRPEPDWPIRLELPDVGALAGGDWRMIEQNTFGEAGIRSLLREHLPALVPPEIVHAAAGWGGDRYAVIALAPDPARAPSQDELAAVWVSTWDTAADADQFARVAAEDIGELADVRLRERHGAHRGTAKGRTWAVVRDGLDVVVLLGVPATAAADVERGLLRLPRHRLTHLDSVAPAKNEAREADKPAAEPASL